MTTSASATTPLTFSPEGAQRFMGEARASDFGGAPEAGDGLSLTAGGQGSPSSLHIPRSPDTLSGWSQLQTPAVPTTQANSPQGSPIVDGQLPGGSVSPPTPAAGVIMSPGAPAAGAAVSPGTVAAGGAQVSAGPLTGSGGHGVAQSFPTVDEVSPAPPSALPTVPLSPGLLQIQGQGPPMGSPVTPTAPSPTHNPPGQQPPFPAPPNAYPPPVRLSGVEHGGTKMDTDQANTPSDTNTQAPTSVPLNGSQTLTGSPRTNVPPNGQTPQVPPPPVSPTMSSQAIGGGPAPAVPPSMPSHVIGGVPAPAVPPSMPSQAFGGGPAPAVPPSMPSQAIGGVPAPAVPPSMPSQAIGGGPAPAVPPSMPSQAIGGVPAPAVPPSMPSQAIGGGPAPAVPPSMPSQALGGGPAPSVPPSMPSQAIGGGPAPAVPPSMPSQAIGGGPAPAVPPSMPSQAMGGGPAPAVPPSMPSQAIGGVPAPAVPPSMPSHVIGGVPAPAVPPSMPSQTIGGVPAPAVRPSMPSHVIGGVPAPSVPPSMPSQALGGGPAPAVPPSMPSQAMGGVPAPSVPPSMPSQAIGGVPAPSVPPSMPSQAIGGGPAPAVPPSIPSQAIGGGPAPSVPPSMPSHVIGGVPALAVPPSMPSHVIGGVPAPSVPPSMPSHVIGGVPAPAVLPSMPSQAIGGGPAPSVPPSMPSQAIGGGPAPAVPPSMPSHVIGGGPAPAVPPSMPSQAIGGGPAPAVPPSMPSHVIGGGPAPAVPPSMPSQALGGGPAPSVPPSMPSQAIGGGPAPAVPPSMPSHVIGGVPAPSVPPSMPSQAIGGVPAPAVPPSMPSQAIGGVPVPTIPFPPVSHSIGVPSVPLTSSTVAQAGSPAARQFMDETVNQSVVGLPEASPASASALSVSPAHLSQMIGGVPAPSLPPQASQVIGGLPAPSMPSPQASQVIGGVPAPSLPPQASQVIGGLPAPSMPPPQASQVIGGVPAPSLPPQASQVIGGLPAPSMPPPQASQVIGGVPAPSLPPPQVSQVIGGVPAPSLPAPQASQLIGGLPAPPMHSPQASQVIGGVPAPSLPAPQASQVIGGVPAPSLPAPQASQVIGEGPAPAVSAAQPSQVMGGVPVGAAPSTPPAHASHVSGVVPTPTSAFFPSGVGEPSAPVASQRVSEGVSRQADRGLTSLASMLQRTGSGIGPKSLPGAPPPSRSNTVRFADPPAASLSGVAAAGKPGVCVGAQQQNLNEWLLRDTSPAPREWKAPASGTSQLPEVPAPAPPDGGQQAAAQPFVSLAAAAAAAVASSCAAQAGSPSVGGKFVDEVVNQSAGPPMQASPVAASLSTQQPAVVHQSHAGPTQLASVHQQQQTQQALAQSHHSTMTQLPIRQVQLPLPPQTVPQQQPHNQMYLQPHPSQAQQAYSQAHPAASQVQQAYSPAHQTALQQSYAPSHAMPQPHPQAHFPPRPPPSHPQHPPVHSQAPLPASQEAQADSSPRSRRPSSVAPPLAPFLPETSPSRRQSHASTVPSAVARRPSSTSVASPRRPSSPTKNRPPLVSPTDSALAKGPKKGQAGGLWLPQEAEAQLRRLASLLDAASGAIRSLTPDRERPMRPTTELSRSKTPPQPGWRDEAVLGVESQKDSQGEKVGVRAAATSGAQVRQGGNPQGDRSIPKTVLDRAEGLQVGLADYRFSILSDNAQKEERVRGAPHSSNLEQRMQRGGTAVSVAKDASRTPLEGLMEGRATLEDDRRRRLGFKSAAVGLAVGLLDPHHSVLTTHPVEGEVESAARGPEEGIPEGGRLERSLVRRIRTLESDLGGVGGTEVLGPSPGSLERRVEVGRHPTIVQEQSHMPVQRQRTAEWGRGLEGSRALSLEESLRTGVPGGYGPAVGREVAEKAVRVESQGELEWRVRGGGSLSRAHTRTDAVGVLLPMEEVVGERQTVRGRTNEGEADTCGQHVESAAGSRSLYHADLERQIEETSAFVKSQGRGASGKVQAPPSPVYIEKMGTAGRMEREVQSGESRLVPMQVHRRGEEEAESYLGAQPYYSYFEEANPSIEGRLRNSLPSQSGRLRETETERDREREGPHRLGGRLPIRTGVEELEAPRRVGPSLFRPSPLTGSRSILEMNKNERGERMEDREPPSAFSFYPSHPYTRSNARPPTDTGLVSVAARYNEWEGARRSETPPRQHPSAHADTGEAPHSFSGRRKGEMERGSVLVPAHLQEERESHRAPAGPGRVEMRLRAEAQRTGRWGEGEERAPGGYQKGSFPRQLSPFPSLLHQQKGLEAALRREDTEGGKGTLRASARQRGGALDPPSVNVNSLGGIPKTKSGDRLMNSLWSRERQREGETRGYERTRVASPSATSRSPLPGSSLPPAGPRERRLFSSFAQVCHGRGVSVREALATFAAAEGKETGVMSPQTFTDCLVRLKAGFTREDARRMLRALGVSADCRSRQQSGALDIEGVAHAVLLASRSQ
uniref:Uncharacterized protein n=1 Tax=Chromera velia CCMP2878 TaxID=1169474 RepID=A0A0G4HY09_9ALVE